MRLTSFSPHTLGLVITVLLLALLSPSVLSQTFLFNTVSASLPWSPRNNPGAILAPYSADSLLFFGGSNGRTDNDVWLSSDSGATWSLQSGMSVSGDAPGTAADQSFPATVNSMLAYDPISHQSFHYSGSNVTDNVGAPTNATYYSPDGIKWAQATYAADSPTPDYRSAPGNIVTTSNTERDPSFLLIGGLVVTDGRVNVTLSSQVWKSSAVPDKPDVREWTVVGHTMDEAGRGFVHAGGVSSVLVDRNRLDGRDIVFAIGGLNLASGIFSDEVWASSDEGATWVQLAASSFGARFGYAAAVTDSGILFVLGGVTGDQSRGQQTLQPDMWASFDGGYTWSLCTNALLPRSNAVMAFDSYTQQLMYGMGFNSSDEGAPTSMNDLYSANIGGDPSAIAEQCSTTVPAEGVGLTRWPATADSSSTGAADSSSSSSSSGSSISSSTAAASSSSGINPTGGPATSVMSTAARSSTGMTASSSSGPVPIPPSTASYSSSSSSFLSSSSSSSSSTGTDSGGDGGEPHSSSSNTGVLTTFTILFAALTVACAVLAYTQYRLRVYGTVCCEWCAGVTCGQLCGETVGWGTKWQRRSNLSDADLLRQVASDRYD